MTSKFSVTFIGALGLAIGVAAPAAAQGVLTTHRLSAALAAEAVTEAVAACTRQGYHVTATIVDPDGAIAGDAARRRRRNRRGQKLLRQGLHGDHARRDEQRGFRAAPSPSASAPTRRPAASPNSIISRCSRERFASKSATRRSPPSASAARPAAITTKRAPRPASTRSPTGSK